MLSFFFAILFSLSRKSIKVLYKVLMKQQIPTIRYEKQSDGIPVRLCDAPWKEELHGKYSLPALPGILSENFPEAPWHASLYCMYR